MKAIAAVSVLCLIVSSVAFAIPSPLGQPSSRYFWEPIPFIRGDTNEDDKVDIADVITTIEYLYGGKTENLDEDCLGRADVNDDVKVDLADIVCSISYIFGSGQPPAPPFPEEDYDVRADSKGEMVGLGCWRFNTEL